MSQQVDGLLRCGIVEAGIDWLTITATEADARLGLGVCARRQAREIAGRGNEVLPWSFSGYNGFRTRGLQWGERFDTTIVRLSSDAARENWWEFYQIGEHVTRADWQVTHRSEIEPYRRIMDHHKAARRFWTKRKDGPTITLVCDDRGGATLYLGKRSSRVMLRCYSKHAESQEERYLMCVRYEVELKDRIAPHLMALLSDGRVAHTQVIAQVHEMFEIRGVSPPFTPECPPLTQDNGPKRYSDVDRKRGWLRSQVQPSVQFLVGAVGMAAIAEDLGLHQFADAGLNTYRPLPEWSNDCNDRR